MIKTTIVLAGIVLICSVSALKNTYTISKSYLSSTQASAANQIPLGKLSIFEQGELNQAYIETNQPIFVTQQQVNKYNVVILTFRNLKGKEYRTAVTSHGLENIKGKSYSEKIQVSLSSNDEVVGFSYVRTNNPNQDITVQINSPEKGVDHVFKVETQQKAPQVQQSFFSKYKWPLIIGGVLLYMTMNADPQKLQGQAQPRPQ